MLFGDNEYLGPLDADGMPNGKGTMIGKKHTSSPVTTIGEGKVYTGDFIQGVRTGKGSLSFPNGFRYDGDFIKGKFHGQGRSIFPDGSSYVGSYKTNHYSGFGVLIEADGSKYEGDWLAGHKNGRGIQIWPNGNRYEGIFSHGLLEEGILTYNDGGQALGYLGRFGTVIRIWPNGDRYEGNILEGDIRDGRGKMLYADGRVEDGYFSEGKYIGTEPNDNVRGLSPEGELKLAEAISKWAPFINSVKPPFSDGPNKNSAVGDNLYIGPTDDDGLPHGKGRLVGQTHTGGALITSIGLGNKYEGNFVHGKRTGYGLLTCVIENYREYGVFGTFVYEGNFEDGKFHGVGKITAENGEVYQGQFSEGQKTGRGVLTRPAVEGRLIIYAEGNFLKGKLVGSGVLKYSFGASEKGDRYEGQVVDGKPHGAGTLTTREGDTYIGNFVQGEKSGVFTISYADGGTYSGEMRHDELMPYGTRIWSNGDRYEGQYFMGLRSGKGVLTRQDGSKQDGYFLRDEYQGPVPTDELLRYMPIVGYDAQTVQPSTVTKLDRLPATKNLVQPHLETISSLIGLRGVKDQVTRLSNFLEISKIRREQGLQTSRPALHFVFSGKPGTGKTTVARELGRIFNALGLLEKGHVVEVKRKDLVAQFEGQSAIKTHDKVLEALDGVLFIDEAYSLTAREGSNVDFGEEAVTALLSDMEDYRDRLIVIVAGYDQKMKDFIASNPGLSSRFNRQIDFEDYTAKELLEIFEKFARDAQYTVDKLARNKLGEHFFMATLNRGDDFGNARMVRDMFDVSIENQAARLLETGVVDRNSLMTIKAEDLPVFARK